MWPDFWREKARQFKSQRPLREDTILREGIALIRMATSQPTETQVKSEIDVDEAVKEILAEMEAEEQDPLEGMGNAQIAEVYHRMKLEDQRLFRQFKRFHKRYYETHGHDAPSHQLSCGIVQQMFPGLPSADAETIAKARAELLATERLKELCKQLGLAIPTQLQAYPPPPEAPEYRRHLSHHDSCQDRTRRGWRLNNNLRQRLKKLKPSRTSNQEGWPPRIWVPQDCCG